MSQMEIYHLRCFLAVASELDFTKAAQALQMSVPALRQRIEVLETEVGAPLFDRSARYVRLTPAGERLVPQAFSIVSDVDALRDQLADDQPIAVRVAVPELLGSDIDDRLTAALADLASDYTCTLEHLRSADMAASLHGNHIDLALSHIPSAGAEVDSVIIATEPMGVLVDATLFTGRTSIRLADLDGFTHIRGPEHWELTHDTRTALSGKGIDESTDRFKTIDGLLMMLRRTRAFLLAPVDSEGLSAVDRTEFRFLPVEDLNLEVSTALLWRADDARFGRLAADLTARLAV
ncbi:LysR family transcriptional regulator [Nocardia ninae]|uniref:Putative transcriptional regulator, LysR family protein n=2 Tax=Nocardia ninae TaxID=356145 RepID=A0A511MVR9_9NOCA|nr:putative transcriptional regulator, LysR family protein [Nocardia ninae NBRC 108245]